MRVLILVDSRFAIHERALIERVLVGLADEGIRAQLVLPKGRDLEEFGFDMLCDPIWYADRGLSLTRSIRATQVARKIANGSEMMTGLVDIVHVFGGGAWAMGRELARILGAGMVFEVWRAGLIDSAKSLHLDQEDKAMFLVPERSFEDGLTSAGFGHRVQLARWGAQVPHEPAKILNPEKTASIVLMSSGRQKDQCIAAFEGIADAIESRPDVMVFANLEVVERAGLWSRVVNRKIDDRFTIIDRSEDRRDLLLRCDVMVYPDTLHEERTLLLDAMGVGMAIIAGNDDHIAPIQDASGISIVDRPSRSSWASRLNECLDGHMKARESGLNVREYVKLHRRAGMYIESILDAYNELLGIEEPEESV